MASQVQPSYVGLPMVAPPPSPSEALQQCPALRMANLHCTQDGMVCEPGMGSAVRWVDPPPGQPSTTAAGQPRRAPVLATMRDTLLGLPPEERPSAVAGAEAERSAAALAAMQLVRMHSDYQTYLCRLSWIDSDDEDVAAQDKASEQLEQVAVIRREQDAAAEAAWQEICLSHVQCFHQQQAPAESAPASGSAMACSSSDAPVSLPPTDAIDEQDQMVNFPPSYPLTTHSCHHVLAMQLHSLKIDRILQIQTLLLLHPKSSASGLARLHLTFVWLWLQDINMAIAMSLQDEELVLVGQGVSLGVPHLNRHVKELQVRLCNNRPDSERAVRRQICKHVCRGSTKLCSICCRVSCLASFNASFR